MNILLITNCRTTLFGSFIDKLIIFNDQDNKKVDRGKETHVLAGVRLLLFLGTVRIRHLPVPFSMLVCIIYRRTRHPLFT